MKTINRRALAALVFGFLTVGAGGAGFAQEPAKHGCCAGQESWCSLSECCTAKSHRQVTAYNQNAERYRAKYGREYPGTRVEAKNNVASHGCSKSCC